MKKSIVIVGLLLLAACARHDELPSALQFLEPPVPSDFTVTTADFISFELEWDVDDPSNVSYYRIYWQSAYSQPALLDTTRFTSAVVTTEDQLPIRGVVFCVSTVTTENVEGPRVCAAAE